ncbi:MULTISPECIES: M23 family metallopeptidase [unclassified Leucobacter]|uniref:M23 family metallopeptidase n=1 Tax=unclassified Leucobacter TaxID=2621730 RepID=UPI00165D86EB|nr:MULTISPECIES: peptidoglycan DD-metalloendopeptidase family protein [unclassified Leucobacter]MBC9928043.1 M23 family metallopeptidase [Leucobacter sp. cx-169]MBC9935494.1 M23 family metallopeptidase [Leucobacter sp. cx-87]
MSATIRTTRWARRLLSIGAMFAAVGGIIPGGTLWAPPLGPPLRVAEQFRAPPNPYAAGHRGLDVAALTGTPVLAPASGVVTFAGNVVDRPLLSIRVDERTLLSLEPVTTELLEGALVSRGVEVGTVATGGHCGTRCLHLGVRVDGEYVNPLRFFAGRPKLLPW